MLRLLADENFSHDIVRGLRSRHPFVDLVSAQDVGLSGADDPAALAWAAANGRVVLTHDVRTMAAFAHERVRRGLRMPGIFVISQDLPVGQVIEDLLLLVDLSADDEWDGRVEFLPL